MTKIDERSVFINCPFDASYEPLFLGLIAALVSLSRVPRSVLEIPEDGAGRLSRLCDLIAESRVSIHDLSRVGLPARFNMPFELGLACATAQFSRNRYGFFLLERKSYRLDQTLSDLKGRDPIIHGGSHVQLINGVLSEFSVRGQAVEPAVVHGISRRLKAAVADRKRTTRQRSIYNRSMFKFAVSAAMELAVEAELIKR